MTTTEATTSLFLHQTLHGYGDGHQLLANSLDLTAEQKWQVLVMSDLSGPTFQRGFESYLTGYPLSGTGYFCLARTWYAPEMPRPGCVWTHTLFISDTDLARIRDFSAIAELFQRPKDLSDLASYQHTVDTILSTSGAACDTQLSHENAASVLSALYSTAGQVAIRSNTSSSYESLVLAIFSQQWPRLRRTFKFCTGLLAPKESTFDLVICPSNAVLGPTIVALDARIRRDCIIEGSETSWAQAAAEDLTQGNPSSSLRKFLWKFGPDLGDGRKVFQALCEIHLTAFRGESVSHALSAVSHFFPDQSVSARLKAALFGYGGMYSASPQSEAELLRALFTHPASDCIPNEVADIGPRARRLLGEDPRLATTVAADALAFKSPHAESFLNGYATGLTENATRFPSVPLALAIDLVNRHFILAFEPALWRRPAADQSLLAAHALSLPSYQAGSLNIARAVVDAKAWSALNALLTQDENTTVEAIFQWVNSSSIDDFDVPSQAVYILRHHRHMFAKVLQRVNPTAKSLKLATLILDPRSLEVRGCRPEVWVNVTDYPFEAATQADELRSDLFLLAIGLSHPESASAALLAHTFSKVYEAARLSQLDENDAWDYVDPYLPWHSQIWDKCERLIRGGVNAFLYHDWPVEAFLETFRTVQQFERAIAVAEYTYSGRRYIRNLCDLYLRQQLTIPTDLISTLDHYCHRIS